MAKINEFKKVKEKDTRMNNMIMAFMAGIFSVFCMTGFSESVAVECGKCFSIGLGFMVIDMIIQYIKGNFDKIQKTEIKEANKKEA